MKNAIENFAVLLVIVLIGAIVVLIAQYNLINDNDHMADISKFVSKQLENTKENTKSYLEQLEHYKEEAILVNSKNGKHSNGNVNKTKEKNDNIINEIDTIVNAAIKERQLH